MAIALALGPPQICVTWSRFLFSTHTRNQLRKTESRTQNLSLGGYFYCHIVGWILFEVAWEFLYFWRFHDILNFNYYCTTSAHCLKINPNFKALFLTGGILKVGLILTLKYNEETWLLLLISLVLSIQSFVSKCFKTGD